MQFINTTSAQSYMQATSGHTFTIKSRRKVGPNKLHKMYTRNPCYLREDRAMPLQISVPYVSNFTTASCGLRFLCHSMAFLYMSKFGKVMPRNTVASFFRTRCIHHRMLKLHTVRSEFHGRDAKSRRSPKITAHDQNHSKSYGDREYVTVLQR